MLRLKIVSKSIVGDGIHKFNSTRRLETVCVYRWEPKYNAIPGNTYDDTISTKFLFCRKGSNACSRNRLMFVRYIF